MLSWICLSDNIRRVDMTKGLVFQSLLSWICLSDADEPPHPGRDHMVSILVVVDLPL